MVLNRTSGYVLFRQIATALDLLTDNTRLKHDIICTLILIKNAPFDEVAKWT